MDANDGLLKGKLEISISMSLYVRKITNGEKEWWYVRDALAEPEDQIKLYDQKEDIPKSIRHYAKDETPVLWGPDLCRIQGCLETLYPELVGATCSLEGFENEVCIFDSCGIPECWKTCEYLKFRKGNKNENY